MNKSKKRCQTLFSPVVTFSFEKPGENARVSLQTQCERLRTQIAPKSTRWDGKILVHVEIDNLLAIRNIITSKTIATLSIPFTPDSMALFGNSFLFNAREAKKLYLVDKQLTAHTCVYTTTDTINTMLSLPNRTVALGITEGIQILNSDWVCIKYLSEENTINMIALKSGKVASTHEDWSMKVCIWDQNWNIEDTVSFENCYRLVELGSGLCVYGHNGIAFNIEKETKEMERDKCTYVMILKNGLRAEFFAEAAKLKLYDGENLVREKNECAIENVWEWAVAEVSTGIIAWEYLDSTLMVYDVDRDLFVEGFPKRVYPKSATLRCFIYD